MTGQVQSVGLQLAPMEASEEQIIEEVRSDPAVFGILYRKYLSPVYRYLYSKVGNKVDAEDLTSQVFLAAFEGLPGYRHQNLFASWLFSIARRKAADYYRACTEQISLDGEGRLPPVEGDALAQIIQDEELQSVVKLIANLPEDEHELLRLRFAARLSFDEIAHVVKRKPSAVKMSLYRLLERLEKQLEAAHE